MLETNATLPKNMEKLVDTINLVSMDIKLPEHFSSIDTWTNVFNNELQTIKVLESADVDYYIKIVVSPTTAIDTVSDINDHLYEITNNNNLNIILQPVSPMSQWKNKDHLFELSELVGERFDVSIIPQIHKYLDIR